MVVGFCMFFCFLNIGDFLDLIFFLGFLWYFLWGDLVNLSVIAGF